jgi:hypothetical protein
MFEVHVYLDAMPIHSQWQADEWLAQIVSMTDGSGVLRRVGINDVPDTSEFILRKDLDACLCAIHDALDGNIPPVLEPIFELRGLFGSDARAALSILVDDAFPKASFTTPGSREVFDIIVGALSELCENDDNGVFVFH